MLRTAVALAAAAACLLVSHARADQRPTPREAEALQETMEQAIRDAEPAIACVLVSRSEAYCKWFGERPHPDRPGHLGAFDPETVQLDVPPDELPPVRAGEDPRLVWLRRHANPRDVELARGDRRREEHALVLAIKRHYDLGNRDNVPEAYGSGVVIDTDGLVLTAYHVVRGATKVFVRLPGGAGSYADIHAADPRSDLAVLRLLDRRVLPLRPIRFGDGGKVRKGQWVLCLANPFAAGFRDGSPSASWGIVSNLRRRAPGKAQQEERQKTLHQYGTLIQTDARLALGCSGGALINLRGEMIGMTTTVVALAGSERGGGFAIPLDDRMKRIIEILRRGEEVEYGFLGVGTDDAPRGQEGVLVRSVAHDSPARRAGLEPMMRILKINGLPVRASEDLFLFVGGSLAGSEVEIEVADRPQPARATLAKFWVNGPIIAANRPQPFRGLRVDYTSVWYQKLSGFEQFSQGIPRGVVVSEVEPDSRAQAAGLKVEDIIRAVNGQLVANPADFYRIVRNLNGPVEFTLSERDRDGRARTVRID